MDRVSKQVFSHRNCYRLGNDNSRNTARESPRRPRNLREARTQGFEDGPSGKRLNKTGRLGRIWALGGCAYQCNLHPI